MSNILICEGCEALREELLEERALNMKASGIEQERTADAEVRVAAAKAEVREQADAKEAAYRKLYAATARITELEGLLREAHAYYNGTSHPVWPKVAAALAPNGRVPSSLAVAFVITEEQE